MNLKRFPVMLSEGGARIYVPWAIGVEAWQQYAKRFTGQSCERIAERGGFGTAEMDALRPGWRDHVITP